MSNSKDLQPGSPKVSRREMLKLTAAGAAGLTFLQRRSVARTLSKESFLDLTAVERIADRDTATLKPPLLIDLQTHVWWRAGGIAKMSPRGETFLKTLAGARASVIGRPVPVADMGRVMLFDDIFMQSQTDIAFLNSFGMKGAFDGIDLFPPREAAMIRSMAPARIRVLGCVDPPDGKSAVESLTYQCEALKIDGLKLYPPGPDTRGWRMDDEKNTYPLYEVLRKHGVKNVTVHKGLPGIFLEDYCHTGDMVRAAADFPDLNFIAFHCSYPWDAELADYGKKAKVKNIYAEMGAMAQVMVQAPERFATMLGTLIDGLGADHILWGTDTPVIGPPHWQIQGFQAFTIPDQMIEKNNYKQLTTEVKNKILGENAARLFNIDIKAARKAVEGDLLYKLREDGNPLPVVVDINKLRRQ
ncbi:MAG: amidohydrolase family protein [Acidobacteriota bacterium]